MTFIDRIIKKLITLSNRPLEPPLKNTCSDSVALGKTDRDSSHDRIAEKVLTILHNLAEKSGLPNTKITLDCSLEELEYTSLDIVSLTADLEKSLGISRFPMQEWLDEEAWRKDKRFTVRSLVKKCTEQLC